VNGQRVIKKAEKIHRGKRGEDGGDSELKTDRREDTDEISRHGEYEERQRERYRRGNT
jgi:hypothetical protein